MVSTTLSTGQWHSAEYLLGLCHKDVVFALPEQASLALCEHHTSESQQLVILAQCLNLEKLYALQCALADVLSVDYFFAGREDSQGCSILAPVTVHQADLVSPRLEQVANQLQLDLAVLGQRPTLSRPGILLMDMDSTVIGVECIDEIAKLAGVGEQVSQVTELAMQGKLDFAESLQQRVACLAGAKQSLLAEVRAQLPINPGISALLASLKKANWKLAMASGGFSYFADYLQQRLGLDYVIANQLEINQQQLSGKVSGEIVTAQTKAQTLARLCSQFDIAASQTVALGDGANDLPMLQAASLGVAYHAKPVVRQQAHAALRFSPADGLLAYLQQR